MDIRRTFALISLVALTACTQNAPVSEAIRKRLTEGTSIKIAELTTFDWDTFCVFSPYTTKEDVCTKLNPVFAECKTTVLNDVEEGSYLLAFTKNGRIVHRELFRRGKADFCEMSCVIELSRGRAVFKVSRISTPLGKSHNLYLVASAA